MNFKIKNGVQTFLATNRGGSGGEQWIVTEKELRESLKGFFPDVNQVVKEIKNGQTITKGYINYSL